MFDVVGRPLAMIGSCGSDPIQFETPLDVACLDRHFAPSSSSSSLLLVADHHNKRISTWTANGQQHIINFHVQGQPRGVCVDMNGLAIVACGYPAHSVQIYEPRKSFRLLQVLGARSVKKGLEPGSFIEPSGVCVDDINTLIVADSNNGRVQFFT